MPWFVNRYYDQKTNQGKVFAIRYPVFNRIPASTRMEHSAVESVLIHAGKEYVQGAVLIVLAECTAGQLQNEAEQGDFRGLRNPS